MILTSFNSMKKIMMSMTMMELKKKKIILIKKILN
jgi:hypothetical protein